VDNGSEFAGKVLDAWALRLNEVLQLIAQLGRFLGCKGGGELGVKTSWHGLQQVRAPAQTSTSASPIQLLSLLPNRQIVLHRTHA
jgi:hypothetical protein